ncbi:MULTISPECIES: alpha/beta fold hydrolase [unclassified Bradyrhizobium]
MMTFLSRLTLNTCRKLMLAAALLSATAYASSASAQTSFYDAPRSMLAGQPGTLVRQEVIDGAPLGATAYRVLYRSTGMKGEPIFVSGVVIVPQGDPPPEGRPIVAWAHPTTGVTPRCAPSLAIFLFQQIQGLRSFLEHGYVVAATDYPGLGTPETHPYLVGDSEARAVLDSVRVARTMPGAGGGRRFTVWGHSQGGQASLFTGLIAKTYAPELTLLGVAAAAPATDLVALMNDDINSIGGKNITAMTLWSWHRVYDASLGKIVDPRAMPVIDQLARECIEGPFDLAARQKTGEPLEQHFLTVEQPADTEPWHSLLEKNTPGPLPADIPIFLAQGTTDPIIRPQVTEDYMKKLCSAGSKVQMMLMPNIGHGRAAQASTATVVRWIDARFAGETPPTDCSN